MANQDLIYDMTKVPGLQPKQQAIYGRVGDGNLKATTVHVLSNEQDYNLAGITPQFEGVKPDGTVVIDKQGGIVLDAQGGKFRYVFPPEAFTAKGTYQQAFFRLLRGDQTDSTIDITVNVAENLVEMGINSKDYLSEYDQLIQQALQAEQDFETKLTARVDEANVQLKNLNEAIDNLSQKYANQNVITKQEFDDIMSKVVFTQNWKGAN